MDSTSAILISLALLAAIARISYVLYRTGRPLRGQKSLEPLSTLIVLGSGELVHSL
uniref:Uncharacterized protein n=1 Tax=Rhizophora mucronata TaxID=61149 RepID=A0A2P2JBD3_RHIMU